MLIAPLALALPHLAEAQDAEQESQEQNEERTQEEIEEAEEEGLVRLVEEVTVTGSLIPREDLTALSPVAVLDEIDFTTESTSRVEDLVVAMPQVFAVQNSTVANGASGTATVSLRGLGSVRTLVLINGRRMPPGDAESPAADLNFIPSALVKRVDVLTGGAGAAYGADAVSGVVNFVLDTDFEGVKGYVRFNGFQHNNSNEVAQQINLDRGFDVPTGSIFDGESFAAHLAVGGKIADGKGHASAYLDFRDVSAVTKSERDYFNCSVNRGSDGPACGGSSTTPQGRFISFRPDGSLNGDFVLDPSTGNTFKPRQGEVFNFGPFNHIQRPDQRWAGGGFAHYTVNRHFEPYAEVMFMDNSTDAQIAPTGNFGRTSTINCDNPMLSAQQRDLICTQAGYGPDDYASVTMLRRNLEGGARTDLLSHTALRLLGGMRGDISDTWRYDIYGLHATVSSPQVYVNDIHIDRIGDALDVIGDPNDPSTWRCRSGNPGCSPWNVFTNRSPGFGETAANVADGATQAAIDYMSVDAVNTSFTQTQQVVGVLYGDLEDAGLMFPTASEGVGVAVGAEYRKERLRVRPDDPRSKGLIAGFGGATVPVDGAYNVKELFAETLIPVVQDTRGVQDLSFELGYRYSDYDTAGGQHSWKTLLSYAPARDLRVRVGLNQAVRAPNARELFAPQRFGLGGNEDICANDPATGIPSATLEQCQRTGVTPAQYGTILPNPAQQYNTRLGGNPLLNVENAKTLTLGIVFTPPSIPGLAFTADYYDIKIDETISSLDADDIINTCANTGDSQLCGLINRDRVGSLWLTTEAFTETTSQNIGELRGRGVDLSLFYPLNLGNKGFLNVSGLATVLIEDTFRNPLTEYNCAGFYGAQCGQPRAKWRHRIRASWVTTFNTTVSLGWRRVGNTTVDDASDDPDLAASASLVESWGINGALEAGAGDWLDLSASYHFANGMEWVVGVNNILDKDPPLFPSLSSSAFTGTYDPMGRAIYSTFRFQF